MLFSSAIVKLFSNTSGGRNRTPNFVIFVVWSTLIVGGWRLWWHGAENLVYKLAETASFVFLVLLKNGGRKVSPRFQLFVSDVNQVNETSERHFK